MKKGFKPPHFKNQQKNFQQNNQPTQNGNKLVESLEKWSKQPIQCLGCEEDNMYRNCPHQKNNTKNFYNMQKVITVNDARQSTPCIYATLVYHQEYHQLTMFEVEDKVSN